jgi:hypothetical protein
MTSPPKESPDKELVKVFQAAGVVEYLQYLQSSKVVLWTNFKAGVARGFGVTVGMTVVLGVFIWVLTKLINLPVIGEYFGEAQKFIQEYSEKTDYSDEFGEMNGLLREIRDKDGK